MTQQETAMDRVKSTLDDCRPCNIELAEAIREGTAAGQSVKAICEELEAYQIEQHGVAILSAQALRRRYQRLVPAARNGQPRRGTARNGQPEEEIATPETVLEMIRGFSVDELRDFKRIFLNEFGPIEREESSFVDEDPEEHLPKDSFRISTKRDRDPFVYYGNDPRIRDLIREEGLPERTT